MQQGGTISDDTGTKDRLVQVGLVGHGIQKSRTPAMHEVEGHAQGLTYRYCLIDPEAGGEGAPLSQVLDNAEAEGFSGLNITFPYKQSVVELVDDMSDAARRVGAINTVVFRDGRRFGHNTDFWGFSENMRRGLPGAALESVLLVGAGGAGGALAHALRDLGAGGLAIADQRIEAAQALADNVNRIAGRDVARATDDISGAAAGSDGIVNATPVGMAKLPGTPLDTRLLTPRHWVAEIVYFPRVTELLRDARSIGCRTLDGSGMAVFQAVRAFHLFTGLEADPARMRATFESFETG